MESKRRSFAKTLSWRLWATVITMAVVFFATGKVAFAMEIGLADTTIKLAAYFLHERMWNKIDFGREKKPSVEYQI